jgi:tetratricopeptide (TPR) repeat protein
VKARALALALILAVPAAAAPRAACAQAALVDAHAEVAAALFAASATQAAVEKAADAKLAAQRAQIAALAARVRAGEARQAQLAAAQEGFLAELAAKDRAYAAQIAVFRGAVSDIAATPEGAAALARFNAGDEAGALDILDRLRAADDRMRQARADLESAAQGRRIAALAMEARARGRVTTAAVISRYEDVVRLDPGVFEDWIRLGRLYQAAGRLADARGADQTAARLAPGDRAGSIAQNELGDVLAAQGDLAGARAAYEQGLATARRLAAAGPAGVEAQHDIAASLDRIGYLRGAQGDLAGARAAYDEDIAILRRLAGADPQNAGLARDLSAGLVQLGDAQRAQGQLEPARRSYEESLAIARRLAGADPGDTGLQRDVLVALDRVGNGLSAQGDLAGAGRAFDEQLTLVRALAAGDPSNAGLQRDVSVALGKTGDVRRARGDLAGARQAFADSLAIDRRLAAADPTSADLQHDLSAGLDRMGDVLRAQGDLAGAAAAYGECLAVLRRLAAADPTNAGLQQDIASSLDAAGDLAKAGGDLAGAGKAYDEALAIVRRRAAADPASAALKRDVAANLDRTGDVARARGDLAGARKAYEEGAGIVRALIAADPTSAGLRRDRSVGVAKQVGVRIAAGDLAGARALLAAATTEPGATADEWRLRFMAAFAAQDRADALAALTVVARRWPESLGEVPDQQVFGLAQATRGAAGLAAARLALLEALAAARWAPQDAFLSADGLWLELIAARLDAGQVEPARALAAAVAGPDAVAQMRIDRRYDALIRADPASFDVTAVAARNLASLTAASARAADRLEGSNAVAGALLELGRPAEALAVLDDALARGRPAGGAGSPFSDPGQLGWTHDLRARALMLLGRGDEAVAAMTAAARPPAGGPPNGFEQLGLAGLQARLGHAAEAEAALRAVDPAGLSGFGRMAFERVTAQVRALQNDPAGLAAVLAAMRAHAGDAPGLLVLTLVDAGDLDGASAVVVGLLADPQQRGAGLALLQDGPVPATAPDAVLRRQARIRSLGRRPEVKAALAPVGRIETLPLIPGAVWQ